MNAAHLAKLAPLAAGLLLVGCKRHETYDPPHSHVEYIQEQEFNDLVDEANYLGVLVPGDRLVISGDITDIPFDPFNPNNGFDPYDGFAFVSNQPLHIEFRLISHQWADLDLCVYDPYTGQTEFCFETANQPEYGAIDVLSGGVEFHLVVESYSGISGYDLELEVSALYGLSVAAEAGADDELASLSLLRGDAHANRAEPDRNARYVEGHDPLSFEWLEDEAPEQRASND